jgi:hypothetical protein
LVYAQHTWQTELEIKRSKFVEHDAAFGNLSATRVFEGVSEIARCKFRNKAHIIIAGDLASKALDADFFFGSIQLSIVKDEPIERIKSGASVIVVSDP